jgi:hypothetical protein
MYHALLTIRSMVRGIEMQTLCRRVLRSGRSEPGSHSQRQQIQRKPDSLESDVPLTLSRIPQVGLPVPPRISELLDR